MKEVGSRYPGALTAMEVTDWETIKGMRAITCGGTDEYVTNADIATRFRSLSKATIASWVHESSGSQSTHAGFGVSGSTLRFGALWYVMTTVYFTLDEPGTSYGTFSLGTSGWHHLVTVFDGSQSGNANRLLGYVDGQKKMLSFFGTIPATLPSGLTSFDLGRDILAGGPRYWNGSYGDTLLYDRVLSPTEIYQLYRLGPGGWATRMRHRGRIPDAPPPGQNNAAWWLAYQTGL